MFGSHNVNLLILGRATISNIVTVSQTALITVNHVSINYSYIYFLVYYYFSDSGYRYFLLPYIITKIKLFDLDIIALQILPLPLSLSS